MLGKWKKIKTEEVYHCGKWYRVEKDKVLTPGGKEGVYYVIRKDQSSVVIIAVDKNNNIYLTRQHRYTVNKFSVEFPAGWTDKKEPILHSAKRELAEEMSLASNNWKKIGEYIQVAGMSSLKMSIYLAKDCRKSEKIKKDPSDKNLHETLILKYFELRKLIATGKIFDSVTLCAFAVAESQGVFDKHKR